MSDQIQAGLYQHFKGQFYQVIDTARHSETEEAMVVYRALYGDHGLWIRPAAMFTEMVQHKGERVARFARLQPQTGVLEVASLTVKAGLEEQFETAFADAKTIISKQAGFIDLELKRSVDKPSQYLLLVNWLTKEHHSKGFRQSPDYQRWSDLLHSFYDPFPSVEYYQLSAVV